MVLVQGTKVWDISLQSFEGGMVAQLERLRQMNHRLRVHPHMIRWADHPYLVRQSANVMEAKFSLTFLMNSSLV